MAYGHALLARGPGNTDCALRRLVVPHVCLPSIRHATTRRALNLGEPRVQWPGWSVGVTDPVTAANRPLALPEGQNDSRLRAGSIELGSALMLLCVVQMAVCPATELSPAHPLVCRFAGL